MSWSSRFQAGVCVVLLFVPEMALSQLFFGLARSLIIEPGLHPAEVLSKQEAAMPIEIVWRAHTTVPQYAQYITTHIPASSHTTARDC